MDPQAEQAAKHALDAAIGLGAITWPVWAEMLNTVGVVITFVGGIVLLSLRIMIAWHEWTNRKGGA